MKFTIETTNVKKLKFLAYCSKDLKKETIFSTPLPNIDCEHTLPNIRIKTSLSVVSDVHELTAVILFKVMFNVFEKRAKTKVISVS